MMGQPLRVLVVDDTVLYRKILGDALMSIPGIEVVGTAANGQIALSKTEKLKPDLVTLDIEMPVMNGLETLQAFRAKHPRIKAIMVSSHSQQGADITMKALSLGAFDFIAKPAEGDWKASQTSLQEQLLSKLTPLLGKRSPVAPPLKNPSSARSFARSGRIEIVAIGVSTGGPKALAQVIPALPVYLRVPVVIVQHMPAMFTGALAQSLNAQSALKVQEGQAGQILQPGHVYLAPGGKHMRLIKRHMHVEIDITDDPPENFCKPAVDYLFRSVAQIYGGNSLGVILTGMGADGTKGLLVMKQNGSPVIAQDEATSVVYGMPFEAVQAGVVDTILPLDKIAAEITRICT